MLKEKRITVTGGKGFLGTHLFKKLEDTRLSSILKSPIFPNTI